MIYIKLYDSFEHIQENISGDEILYHGTSKNAWKRKHEGETTLYLTRDLTDAQMYAYEMAGGEELDGLKPEPVVCSITLKELKKLTGITLGPDWVDHKVKETDTWKDTFETYGTLSVHGNIEQNKNKFKVSKVKTDF